MNVGDRAQSDPRSSRALGTASRLERASKTASGPARTDCLIGPSVCNASVAFLLAEDVIPLLAVLAKNA